MVVKNITWDYVWRELKQYEYGTKRKIQKERIHDFTGQLQPTLAGDGLLRGAKKQYRDNKRRDSLHVLVYEDYYEVHLDRFNPIYYPIEHLAYDAPNWGFLIAALIGLRLLMLSKNNKIRL